MHRVVILCVAAFGLLMVVEMVCKSIDHPANGVMLTRDMIQANTINAADLLADAEPGHASDRHAPSAIHPPHEATVQGEPLWHKIKGGVAGVSGVPGFVPRNCQGGVAGAPTGTSLTGGVCGNLGASGGAGEPVQQRSIDNTQKAYKSGS